MTARPDGSNSATAEPGPDEAFLARVAALGVALPPDRLPAVLEGAQHLRLAARLLREAPPPPGNDASP